MDVLREAASSRARRASDATPSTVGAAPDKCPRKISMFGLLAEEEEKFEEKKKAERVSLSGSAKDLASQNPLVRAALPTHKEEPAAENTIDTSQAKLWNEQELEHMMEDVAVRLRRESMSSPMLAPTVGTPNLAFS
ncbi:hypothetical protein OAD67_01290 [bacterium]|nr:hypothetical protein [bacterium]|tara:strand:+ start:2258 stop:2665 length:408 start_codon:yes stop_codon:yes gene_type:complete